MYTSTLGATPQCLSKAQRDEAVRLCGCLRSGTTPVIKGLWGLGAGDAHTVISISPTQAAQCKPTITMPPDFVVADACAAAAREVCPPRLGRPVRDGSSATVTPESSDDYEDEAVESAMLRQRLMVFGLLGVVLVGGSFVAYRVLKKKG